ncbi:protein of unknown function [Brochothrix thermosphacta]|uniref:Uncharacterized protein n=1 Tax=Brochothrix thermosphacta TaxID=2756 RepID=A0A2X0Q449_BROTH|nr:protein of unknown function [Brochothrix thermosphacta]SPN74343.1 hypothetical protein BTEBP_10135 [Brochothrix thermosphacta]SPP28925.1 hypothetical protein BTBSAS_300009 [Brochothrix thermosphacta]SPP29135.1 hypothetical protein BTTAP_30009 [Brochothrix thermosphacta]
MTPILTLNICIYTYSMLYYKHIVIEMYGILLVVFVDTFSHWRGYRATRT